MLAFRILAISIVASFAIGTKASNSSTTSHMPCNGTLPGWDKSAYGMTTTSTCTSKFWICSRQKFLNESQRKLTQNRKRWTCKCHPFWSWTYKDGKGKDYPYGDMAWPGCYDGTHFSVHFPQFLLLALEVAALCHGFYGIYLNFALGDKINYDMLLNQSLLITASLCLTLLTLAGFARDFQIFDDDSYNSAFAVLLPTMVFFSVQANLLLPGQWIEVFTKSSIKVSREDRDKQAWMLKTTIIGAQIIVTLLSATVTFVFNSSTAYWFLVFLASVIFLILFYLFGGEKLSSFLIDAAKGSKSGAKTKEVGVRIRFVSRAFVAISVVAIIVMIWYSNEYNSAYAQGGFKTEASATSMVVAYSCFLGMCVCLCIAANHFYVATLGQRVQRRKEKLRNGTSVATSSMVTTEA